MSSRSVPKRVARRRKEPRVLRIRIGTADQRDFDHVVRRDHPRVARMKLIGQPFAREGVAQRVHAIGDKERRAFLALGQKVPHRPVHRPRQPDRDPLAGDQRERSVDRAHRVRVAAQHAPARLVGVHVVETVQCGVEEIDHTSQVSQHARDCKAAGATRSLARRSRSATRYSRRAPRNPLVRGTRRDRSGSRSPDRRHTG